MTRVSMDDNGRMAAVFAPLAEIERILKTVDGYVVIANINSNSQAVIGGASKAVEQAIEAVPEGRLQRGAAAGQPRLPHLDRGAGQRAAAADAGAAAPAIAAHPDRGERDRRVLSRRARTSCRRCWIFSARRSPRRCSSSRACARCTTPARACSWKSGRRRRCRDLSRMCSATAPDVVSLFTNHPKIGDIAAFNQALCGLYAAGLGAAAAGSRDRFASAASVERAEPPSAGCTGTAAMHTTQWRYMRSSAVCSPTFSSAAGKFTAAGSGRGRRCPGGNHRRGAGPARNRAHLRRRQCRPHPARRAVHRCDPDAVPARHARQAHHAPGQERQRRARRSRPSTMSRDVIKLAGRGGRFRSGEGVRRFRRPHGGPRPRHAAGDRGGHRCAARCRHPAGDALQDHQQGHAAAGPLGLAGRDARRYRRDLRLRFPGLRLLRRGDRALLRGPRPPRTIGDARRPARAGGGRRTAILRWQEIDRRIDELRAAIEKDPYVFDRRFLFRVLSMGHSQFAEYIGARGPNTQVNAACASTTQAVALAEDWIRAGRCRRVIVIIGRRHHLRPPDGVVRRRLPGQRRGRHRREWWKRPRFPSTAAATA